MSNFNERRRVPVSIFLSVVMVSTGLTLGLGTVSYIQRSSALSLSSKVAELTAANGVLQNGNNNLKAKNINLTKAVQSLQKQLSSTAITETPTTTTSLNISAVKIQPGSDFSLANHPQISGDLRVVYLTIRNISNSMQTYDVNAFTATTDTGVVLKPLIYAPYDTKNTWYNSSLVAGGHQDVVIFFTPEQNIVTITWTPVNGTAISTPVPSQPS